MPRNRMRLRDALRLAADLGVQIRQARGTDEIVVSHPTWRRRYRISARRHDATPELMIQLRRMQGG